MIDVAVPLIALPAALAAAAVVGAEASWVARRARQRRRAARLLADLEPLP